MVRRICDWQRNPKITTAFLWNASAQVASMAQILIGPEKDLALEFNPIHGDLDEEITGLHSKISRLKNVAQEIESETKFQNDFVSQLQMTVIKAQAGLKNNVRTLNRSVIQQGSNHLLHVVLFALFCFFVVYLWSKVSRR